MFLTRAILGVDREKLDERGREKRAVRRVANLLSIYGGGKGD